MNLAPLARWAVLAGFLGLSGSLAGCFRDPSVDKMRCLTECPSGYACTMVDGVGRCCKPGDPLCNRGDASESETAPPPNLDSSSIGGDAVPSLEGGIDSAAGASSEAGRVTQVDADVAATSDSAIDRSLSADDGADAGTGAADTPIRDDGQSASSDAQLDRPLPSVWDGGDGASGGAQGTGGSAGTGGAANAGGAGGSGGIGSGGAVATGGITGAGGVGGTAAGTGGAGTGGSGTGGSGTVVSGTGGSGTGGAGTVVSGTGGSGTGGSGTGGSGTGGTGTGGSGTGASGTGGSGTGGTGTGGSGTGGSGTGGSGTGGSGTGGSGTGGSVLCPAGRRCVEMPPAGWSALGWMSTNTSTPCGAGFTLTSLYDSALRPTPEAATCGCACGDPVTHCSTRLYCAPQGAGLGCWDGSGSNWEVNEQCMTITPPPLGTSSGHTCGATWPVRGSATCSPQGQQTVPQYTWDPNAVTCAEPLGTAPSCGTGLVCATNPPGGATGPCVVASGDVACPGARYVHRSVLYQRFVDGRGCNPSCTCADGTATCQGIPPGPSGVYLASSCGGATFATVSIANSCQDVTGPPGAATWGAAALTFVATVTAQCTPGGSSTPIGDVAVADPMTVCCAE